MKNPYEILGLEASATFEEAKARYEQLKAEYGEGRFKEGEEGAEAARKLTELENAWKDILANETVATAVSGSDKGDFAYVDTLIKSGKYEEAQSALDSMTDRGGEWHYYQSIVYYRREWLAESKKQLEAALECDPGNQKYKTALDKLNLVMGNGNVDPRTMGAGQGGQQPYQDPPPVQHGDMLSNCCLAYCLTSLCCDFTRCCM